MDSPKEISLRDLMTQWQETHLERHEAEDHARSLALNEINRRLGEMNELRSQITNERGTYVQREWFDRIHEALRRETVERAESGTRSREILRDEMYKKIEEIQRALKLIETAQASYEGRILILETSARASEGRTRSLESKMANFEGRIWMLGAVMSVIVVGLNILLRYWK